MWPVLQHQLAAALAHCALHAGLNERRLGRPAPGGNGFCAVVPRHCSCRAMASRSLQVLGMSSCTSHVEMLQESEALFGATRPWRQGACHHPTSEVVMQRRTQLAAASPFSNAPGAHDGAASHGQPHTTWCKISFSQRPAAGSWLQVLRCPERLL